MKVHSLKNCLELLMQLKQVIPSNNPIPTSVSISSTNPPAIFISYQWSKQKEIIKLYTRLTSFGLTCWLDIKEMSGGDTLYEKIDTGIRKCHVMISCVTEKYGLSANCRKEVRVIFYVFFKNFQLNGIFFSTGSATACRFHQETNYSNITR